MDRSKKNIAITLRKQGYSYTYISHKIGVGKSTLSYWLTYIPYSPNIHTKNTIGAARTASGLVKNKQKRESLDAAKQLARQDIKSFSKRDLFMLGLGIYIGEGTKTNDQIRIVNSDPAVIALMVRWFKKVCLLSDNNFIVRIHGHSDTDEKSAIKFWKNTLGIKNLAFQKTQIDARLKKSIRNKRKLPFGTLHLTIRSNGDKRFGVLLARRINSWMSLALSSHDMRV